ncbi:MAG TPA: molecular chaperone DnaK, partial [Ktedonobacterales bacterium]|nr:molecular chaperone DnaK [Ktedonobacterales bacterium]
VKSDVETKIGDVRAALATDDVERIKAAREALQQAIFKVSEELYSAAGAATGGDASGSTGPTPDEPIEGQFTDE